MDTPIKFHMKRIIGGEVEEWAAIEMASEGRCMNGLLYNNNYFWSTRWKNGKIVEIRTYLDGLLLNRVLEENEEKTS